MSAAVYIQALSAVSALGNTPAAMQQALFAPSYPQTLSTTEQYSSGKLLPLGLLAPAIELPALDWAPTSQQSRNNALAWAAALPMREQVHAAIAQFGAHRVGLVVGTSTSGVEEGEWAAQQLLTQYTFPAGFDYAVQEVGNVAAFLSQALGLCGPRHVISTACSSGAKALASAARWLQAGMVDAVIAGGVDALCRFTVAGFSALESVSEQRCNPLSANRGGINLGEGAALFLLTRHEAAVRLAGWGESQDAHHMSAPDPTGAGAVQAMQSSLVRAGITSKEIDYINLHGTATPHNDAMESLAVHDVFGTHTPVSSTKPLTGHTLAAAGALEAAIAYHVLVNNPQGQLPVHWWDGAADVQLPQLHVVKPRTQLGRRVRYVLSNSFAFGGSNAALVFAAQ